MRSDRLAAIWGRGWWLHRALSGSQMRSDRLAAIWGRGWWLHRALSGSQMRSDRLAARRFFLFSKRSKQPQFWEQQA